MSVVTKALFLCSLASVTLAVAPHAGPMRDAAIEVTADGAVVAMNRAQTASTETANATQQPNPHYVECRGEDACKDKSIGQGCPGHGARDGSYCIIECVGKAACSGNAKHHSHVAMNSDLVLLKCIKEDACKDLDVPNGVAFCCEQGGSCPGGSSSCPDKKNCNSCMSWMIQRVQQTQHVTVVTNPWQSTNPAVVQPVPVTVNSQGQVVNSQGQVMPNTAVPVQGNGQANAPSSVQWNAQGTAGQWQGTGQGTSVQYYGQGYTGNARSVPTGFSGAQNSGALGYQPIRAIVVMWSALAFVRVGL